MKILVTGGAGFIGSAVCRLFVGEFGATILNVDKLTYAANPESLNPVAGNPRYHFCRADILDRKLIAERLQGFAPDAILHLAAESHVDRSIDGPGDFIRTNIEGTYALLEAALDYWRDLPPRAGGSVPLSPRLDRRGVRLARAARAGSTRTAGTSRIPPMPRRKPLPTISCAPGTRPTACRPS